VNEAIQVFKYKAGQGAIAAASEQLQEAFIANEYHPALQGLNRDDKEKVGDFLTKVAVLKNQLEARVFEQVDSQIAEIKKIASDFDSTKPLAMVNAVKLDSRLRIGQAKLLAQNGQTDDALKAFGTAAEEWPGNPEVASSSEDFFGKEDKLNEGTAEFDRLVKEQNYRGIFDQQLAFATAVAGDTTREQQLKDALTTVQKAEMASEKANMLVMNGDVDGAWETIELATKDWPDDTKLNKLLASLSERSSDFVSAVNKARDAEAKKELGYSLTWYVNALSIYPASSIAKEGKDRISAQILSPAAASDSASGPSAAN
jgi:Flp pilus assembly protein TadD